MPWAAHLGHSPAVCPQTSEGGEDLAGHVRAGIDAYHPPRIYRARQHDVGAGPIDIETVRTPQAETDHPRTTLRSPHGRWCDGGRLCVALHSLSLDQC